MFRRTNMKITVLTSPDGNILATMRQPEGLKGASRFGFTAKEPGHKVYEIELPAHLENTQSAEQLHRALKEHLAKTSR
jgi:hypothetical protein